MRRDRDSNPGYLSVQRFSRPPQSTTLPPLQNFSSEVLFSKSAAKVLIFFKYTSSIYRFLFIIYLFAYNMLIKQSTRICYYSILITTKNKILHKYRFYSLTFTIFEDASKIVALAVKNIKQASYFSLVYSYLCSYDIPTEL